VLKKLAKVSSKGHIVLPKALRKELNINSGDYVEIELENRAIKIVPAKSKAERLAGILKDKVKGKIDFKTIREKVVEEIAKDVAKKEIRQARSKPN
jgi:AbrB family looped-hinge helix DNA binding protein